MQKLKCITQAICRGIDGCAQTREGLQTVTDCDQVMCSNARQNVQPAYQLPGSNTSVQIGSHSNM
jgi:hypothetical protein